MRAIALLVVVTGTMVAGAGSGRATGAAQVAQHGRAPLMAVAPGALLRWSRPTEIDPAHDGIIGAISCPTARFCAGV
jgi:hypothetical protein